MDQKAIKKAQKLLKDIPNGSKRAVVNATNRAVVKGRMEVNKSITKQYTIKATPVKESLDIQKATFSRLGGAVTSSSTTKSLSRFKITPSKMNSRKPKALKANVKKGGLKPIPGAFVARTQKGSMGVFRREGKERYPLEYLKGPSIPSMAKNKEVTESVQKEMVNMFHSRLDHEVTRLLEKY